MERARFATRYREVWAACSELEPCMRTSPSRLAADYMSAVLLRERKGEWWHENEEALTQPWFIWEYAREQGMLMPMELPKASQPEIRVIQPESVRHEGVVRLVLKPCATRGDEGVLEADYAFMDAEFVGIMRTRRFVRSKGIYALEVDETSRPLMDRAVEIAVLLLDEGYAICVRGEELVERIRRGEFVPEHLYWITALPEADQLCIRYPRNVQLHRYVCSAGGRWDGKRVLISIQNADRLEELIHLYGFQLTEEAQLRLETWREAVRSAVIFRERKKKNRENVMPVEDRFRQLLNQSADIPQDLLEGDE